MSIVSTIRDAKDQLFGGGVTKADGIGTLFGVFLPSLLSTFGIIFHLRLGWVVGSYGILISTLTILLTFTIGFMTALSLAAVATNMRIKGGGTYYILSRSFGTELGAAIGIPLYISQALIVAFEIMGLTEITLSLAPHLSPLVIKFSFLVGLTLLTTILSRYTVKIQPFALFIVFLSIGSFFLGGAEVVQDAIAFQIPAAKDKNFWSAFAILFPAVTGIEAGFGMSGTLKNPSRSLPLGTLFAILAAATVFLTVAFFMASYVPKNMLKHDPIVLAHYAKYSSIVLMALLGTSLFGGIGALVGGPRTLQALSRDAIAPRWLARGFGSLDVPLFSTLTTVSIVSGLLFIGNINLIAPILTMFYLTSYGMLNLASGIETVVGNPSWRPTFATPAYVSFFGLLLCVIAMLMIDPGQAMISVLIMAAIFLFVRRQSIGKKLDDIRNGIILHFTQRGIYHLAKEEISKRAWRPSFVVFSGSPSRHRRLVEFASALTRNRGFLFTTAILPSKKTSQEKILPFKERIESFYERRDIRSLVDVVTFNDLFVGMKRVISSSGVGTIVPNTVLLGATRQRHQQLAEVISHAHAMEKNVLVIQESRKRPQKRKGRSQAPKQVDVWWDDDSRPNSHLMLILSHILRKDLDWKNAKITLKSAAPNSAACETRRAYFEEFITKHRLGVECEVYELENDTPWQQAVKEHSAQASVLLLGLKTPEGNPEEYGTYLSDLFEVKATPPLIAYTLSGPELEIF